MRANMPAFGKRTPLTNEHFKEFEDAFGEDPYGLSPRIDQGEEGRFRCFNHEQIRARNENLDISWLRDENAGNGEDFADPEEIAAEIMSHLQSAMEEMEALTNLLEGTVEDTILESRQ
jgi:type I restriction enzyme M protein